MFREERYKYILDLLERDRKVLVEDLAAQFGIGKSMIRKDLQVLEKRKLLQRTYGGAIHKKHVIIDRENFFEIVETDIESKKIIAEKAFKEINDYDTIFLDASSISSIIAELILKSSKRVTIITNMVRIASIISTNSRIHVIFIGGEYKPIIGGNVGVYAIDQIKLYNCDKSFIYGEGVDFKNGRISANLAEDVNIKKAILNISKELYLMVLNEEVNLKGNIKFSNIADFSSIITEVLPSNVIINLLERYNIRLL